MKGFLWCNSMKENRQKLITQASLGAGIPSHTVFDQTKEMWNWMSNWQCPLQLGPSVNLQQGYPRLLLPKKGCDGDLVKGASSAKWLQLYVSQASSNLTALGLRFWNYPGHKNQGQGEQCRCLSPTDSNWRRELESSSLATPLDSFAR